MDTLTISKELIATGLKQEQAEAIARVIDDKNKELITREYLDAKLSATSAELFNRLILAMVAVAGISLAFVKLFFIV